MKCLTQGVEKIRSVFWTSLFFQRILFLNNFRRNLSRITVLYSNCCKNLPRFFFLKEYCFLFICLFFFKQTSGSATNGCITPDNPNIEPIKTSNQCKRVIQHFLRSINVYYKFVQCYAKIRCLLNSLLNENVSYVWGLNVSTFFRKTKKCFNWKTYFKIVLSQNTLSLICWCIKSWSGMCF